MAPEKPATEDKESPSKAWVKVDGIYLPNKFQGTSMAEHIKELRQLKLRDDDVFLCAYPKAGTHWLWEVASMLQQGRPEYEKRPKEQLMIEFVDSELLNKMPSPRIFNTHLPFSMLPVAEMKAKKIKVLHMYRNPKDSVVSYYYMLKQLPYMDIKDLDWFFNVYCSENALYGSYFTYLHQMHNFTQNNPDVPVMDLSYEGMKKNPLGKVKELADFLGLDASETLCKEIEAACTFDNMKVNSKDKEHPTLSTPAEETDKMREAQAKRRMTVDRTKLFYRKGQVGDWKNHLTVAQSERMDQLIEEGMIGLPYTLHFTDS